MKKRLIGMAITAIVMMVLFSACDVETVITYKKASKPSNVDVKNLNSRWLVVTWNAASNGTSYNVYFRKDGTKSIISAGSGKNDCTYVADGQLYYTTVTNINPDQWSAVIPIIPLTTASATDVTPGSSYKFGVRTNDIDTNNQGSDLAWTKSFLVVSY